MSSRLAVFWSELETNFPLGGARRRLRQILGDHVESELEQAGVLTHRRVATTYPCERWAGNGCPRIVRHTDAGGAVAFCGNATRQCETIEMRMSDIDFLAVTPERLAAAIAKPLRIRPGFEALSTIRDGFRFGTFMPEPGEQHAVYFLVCCGRRDYSMAVGALRTQARGQTFAILTPTDRFISEELRRETASAGIPLISLADTVGLREEGGLHALQDPLALFANVGRVPIDAGEILPAPAYFAHALVREPGRAPSWRRLDPAGYQRLVVAAASYDVFADERTKTVIKEKGKQHIANLPASSFSWIRSALASRTRYDPGIADDEGVAAKQLFQRARQAFDIKRGNEWSIFQTELVDNRAVYSFAPNDSVTFAFVFVAHRRGADADVISR